MRMFVYVPRDTQKDADESWMSGYFEKERHRRWGAWGEKWDVWVCAWVVRIRVSPCSQSYHTYWPELLFPPQRTRCPVILDITNLKYTQHQSSSPVIHSYVCCSCVCHSTVALSFILGIVHHEFDAYLDLWSDGGLPKSSLTTSFGASRVAADDAGFGHIGRPSQRLSVGE